MRSSLVLRLCLLGALGMLAACGGSSSGSRQAGVSSGSASDYMPPGPAHDPWGPYIVEAAARYDVPERWVREVMRQESGGRPFVTSNAGAIGLMQVMPGTYAELAARHGLGADPFLPRDNVFAGTAYIREMYDRFGSPAFLAAYNAGPGSMDRYLAGQRRMPDETRRYVASVGPRIQGHSPSNRAAPEVYAVASIGTNPPVSWRPGQRAPAAAPVMMAAARPTPITRVEAAPLPPITAPVREPVMVAVREVPAPFMAAAIAPPERGGFRLISSANASPTLGAPRPFNLSGDWAIQVGAFQSEAQARGAAEAARRLAPELLGHARGATQDVRTAQGVLTRSRLAGLSVEAAIAACQKLERSGISCIALAPDAQA